MSAHSDSWNGGPLITKTIFEEPMYHWSLDYVQKSNLLVNSNIKKILNTMSDTSAVLAGGFVRYLITGFKKPDDIDVFTFEKKDFDSICGKLGGLFDVLAQTETAVTFSVPDLDDTIPNVVQVIKPLKDIENPAQLMSTFDFKIIQCYMTKNKQFFIADGDWEGLNSMDLLTLANVHTPLSTLLRMFKYYKKGFNIPIESITTVLDEYGKLSDKDKKIAVEAANKGLYHF